MSSAIPRAAATLALGLAIVAPLGFRAGWDSFPFSPYPMFSRHGGHVRPLEHVVLVDRDGRARPAPPALVGTPEPMVAIAIAGNAIARGDAPELCRAVAARARETGAAFVEVRRSVFDTRRYFGDGPDARIPLEKTIAARCEVPR